jgi:predicted NBD/HSP70 family sugar kinase
VRVPGGKVLAVDIGRSTIKSAVLEPRGQTFIIASIERSPTISPGLDLTGRLLGLLRRRLQVDKEVGAIGIGTTGQVSPSGHVSAAIPDLYHGNVPLGTWLTEKLQLPVLVRNDVQLMALGEALYGAGRGWSVVFGVAVGSGVGGGIVRNSHLDIGSDGIAGECGHVRAVDGEERRRCWCGGRGCLEVQVSGLAIEDRYHALTGASARATDILRPDRVDEPAAKVIGSVVRELATGLGTLACCVNPDGIVLGGSIGVALAPFLASLEEQMSHHAYLAVRGTKLRVAELGVDAQLYGAAALCAAADQ